MPSGRFTFEGFLSVTKQSRRQHLEELVNEKRTMIFYEAPHKLPATLRDMCEYFGDRNIALVKELTKIHETVERTTLFKASEKYSQESPKGEFVLIIEGKPEEEKKEVTPDDALAIALKLVEGGLSKNEAAKETAKQTGLKKSDIYKLLQNGD
jgi:16S rRNA (cytidine1402-2'-O)-methyltransferase